MGSMRLCPATGTCWTWHRASCRCSRRGSWPTAWGSRLQAEARPSPLPATDLDAVPHEGLTPVAPAIVASLSAVPCGRVAGAWEGGSEVGRERGVGFDRDDPAVLCPYLGEEGV